MSYLRRMKWDHCKINKHRIYFKGNVGGNVFERRRSTYSLSRALRNQTELSCDPGALPLKYNAGKVVLNSSENLLVLK